MQKTNLNTQLPQQIGLPISKVIILIPNDYKAGGLQRSALHIRHVLVENGYEVLVRSVKLVACGHASEYPCIAAISPDSSSKLKFWLQFVIHFRRMLKDHPDCIFIALGLGPTVFLAALSFGIRIAGSVGSERIYPPMEKVALIMRLARRFFYRRLDFVVVQSQLSIDWFCDILRLPSSKVVLIPNVVLGFTRSYTEAPARASASKDSLRKTLVCVGRLTDQKGFDFALETFNLILQRHPDAHLLIVGEGPLNTVLRKTTNRLGLAKNVSFLLPVKNLAEIWCVADVFFLPSRYEGFPNVLAEAMAFGLPSVAFDCPTGPSDLIKHGENGFLCKVGDVKGASDLILGLFCNQMLANQVGNRAKEVSTIFSGNIVGSKWLSLLWRTSQTCKWK